MYSEVATAAIKNLQKSLKKKEKEKRRKGKLWKMLLRCWKKEGMKKILKTENPE